MTKNEFENMVLHIAKDYRNATGNKLLHGINQSGKEQKFRAYLVVNEDEKNIGIFVEQDFKDEHDYLIGVNTRSGHQYTKEEYTNLKSLYDITIKALSISLKNSKTYRLRKLMYPEKTVFDFTAIYFKTMEESFSNRIQQGEGKDNHIQRK